MTVPAIVTPASPRVNRTRCLPIFNDQGTTAERTRSAADAFKSHYGIWPAQVQIHQATDDGSRTAGFDTILETRELTTTNEFMLYAIGEVLK